MASLKNHLIFNTILKHSQMLTSKVIPAFVRHQIALHLFKLLLFFYKQ